MFYVKEEYWYVELKLESDLYIYSYIWNILWVISCDDEKYPSCEILIISCIYISSHVRFRMIMEPANFLILFLQTMMQNELSIRERTYEKCQTKSCISRVPLLYLFYALVITLVQASPFGHYSTPSCNWAVTVG